MINTDYLDPVQHSAGKPLVLAVKAVFFGENEHQDPGMILCGFMK